MMQNGPILGTRGEFTISESVTGSTEFLDTERRNVAVDDAVHVCGCLGSFVVLRNRRFEVVRRRWMRTTALTAMDGVDGAQITCSK
jgi:hypothetical protein